MKSAPDGEVGREEGAPDTGTSFLDGKAQQPDCKGCSGSPVLVRWLETDQKVAWHLQCGQAHASALHPEDTVGTSEATRLDVPDGGLWLRADGAGKSQAPSIFKTITLTSVGLRPSQ